MTSPTPTRESARSVTLDLGDTQLEGTLALPAQATGLVIFVHGSGSSRHSPRNQWVAGQLVKAGFGTLLFDLLTRREEAIDQVTRTYRFDVRMLARRLLDVVCWIDGQAETRGLPKAFFGASTGAAAALVAAAARPHAVSAIVSRGGRPDLAGEFLAKVRAPTLLIVGGNDYDCLALNQSALRKLKSVPSRLQVVPGASHLFEEPGALQQVASAATDWYARWMRPREGPRSSDAADPIRGGK